MKLPKSRKVEKSEVDSDLEAERLYRVRDVSPKKTSVRAVSKKPEDEVTLTMRAVDQGNQSKKAQVKLVVDTGVSRTLIT